MSPSLVSSLSSVIHRALPKDSQEAGNRSRANNREERKGGSTEREIERGKGKKTV